MHRFGEFEVKNPRNVESKCGLEGRFKYTYDVYITNDGTVLPPNGFIIDNNDIHKYFADTYESEEPKDVPSCELMALIGLESVKALLPLELRINKVIVRIHGTQATYFEAEWERE